MNTTNTPRQQHALSVEQLETFRQVVEHGGFAGAAAELRIAPPTVSTRVQRVENALGVPLFWRSTGIRGYQLTAEGEKVAAFAQEVTAKLVELTKDIEAIRLTRTQTVRVGATEEHAAVALPSVYRLLAAAISNVRLQTITLKADDVVGGLRDDSVDCVLTSERVSERNVTSVPVYQDELMLVGSPGAEWMPQPGDKRDVSKLPVFLSAHGDQSRTVMEAWMGSVRNSVIDGASPDVQKQGAIDGVALALLPHSLVQPELRDGTLVALEGFRIKRTVFLAFDRRLCRLLATTGVQPDPTCSSRSLQRATAAN